MSDLIADLDRIIDRIVRNDPVLILERESADWWTVTDAANGDEVMARADREFCIRFMRAFIAKHPDASFDRATVEHSWRVAQQSIPRPVNVIPLRMLEPVDEAS